MKNEEFSQAELDIIKKLNLFPLIKKQVNIKHDVHKMEEYYLQTQTTCLTCNNTEIVYFHMKWDNTSECLNAYKITDVVLDENDVLKATKSSIPICKHCNEILNEMTREELIHHVLNLSRKYIQRIK
jgi:hypothetical protein